MPRASLVINLKTAKALELTIQQSLLLRVDEVIQLSSEGPLLIPPICQRQLVESG